VCLDKGHIEEVMYGRKQSVLISIPLRVLSLFYGFVVRVRLALYSLGALKRKQITQPVVSVGNLTLGGTGKTPTVMNIATVLKEGGKHPAVVSRGYGRRDESSCLVVSDGERVLVDSSAGGDEPVLIGSSIQGLPVLVCQDRFRAATLAYERFGSDVIILDDGFQHVRLHRDLDVVLIDAADPFGNGNLFPAGILREPVTGLKRAQAVLLTGTDRAVDLESLRTTIGRETGATVFTARLVPKDLVDVMTGDVNQLAALRDAAVLAFSGIARPSSFVALLLALGAAVKEEMIFPDHYEYTRPDLMNLYQRASDTGVGMIVTTEKDAARLRGLRPEGIWALRVELSVVEKDEWKAFLLSRL
jgi:tetraacyldisaccharide 4'-kinase